MDDNSKPIVLLDVDGVLGDFLTPAYAIAKEHFGIDKVAEDQDVWDMAEFLGLSKEQEKEFFEHIKKPGFHDVIKPYAESIEGVRALHAIANVHILTSPMFGKTWCSERWDWLYQHYGIKSANVTHSHQKQYVFGHALIDDKPMTIEKWVARHRRDYGVGILWHQRYNAVASIRDISGVVVAKSWDDVLKIVRGLKP